MAIEIERKFLVTNDSWKSSFGIPYKQGYLSRDPQRTVRVRVAGDMAFLTIKGISSGASRPEYEYAIPIADAEELLTLCEGPVIVKTRRLVEHAGFTWEIDEFFGDNAGLLVAEIELTSEDQVFDKPSWVGIEVTDDPRYFNSFLSKHPYKSW